MFSSEVGNFIISSCIICFDNANKYFEKTFQRLSLSWIFVFKALYAVTEDCHNKKKFQGKAAIQTFYLSCLVRYSGAAEDTFSYVFESTQLRLK